MRGGNVQTADDFILAIRAFTKLGDYDMARKAVAELGKLPDQKAASLGRQLLNGWMTIAARFGSVQTLVILSMTYLLLIGPVGLVLAMGRSDPLAKRGLKSVESAWLDADTAKPDLERAKLLS